MATLKGSTTLSSHNDENNKPGIENICNAKATGSAPMMKMNLRSSKYANNMNGDGVGSCNTAVNSNGVGMPSEGVSQRRGLRDITNQTKQANNTIGLHTRSTHNQNQHQQQNVKYKNSGLNTMVYNENIEGNRTRRPIDKATHKSKDIQQKIIPQTSKNQSEGGDMEDSPSAMVMSTSPAEALVTNANDQRSVVKSSGGSSDMKLSDEENDRKNIDFETEMDLCVDKLNISDDIELDTSDDIVVGNMTEHLNEKLNRHQEESSSTSESDVGNNDSLTQIQLQKQQIMEQQELLRTQQMELEKQEELLRQKELEAKEKYQLEQELIQERKAERIEPTNLQQTSSAMNREVNREEERSESHNNHLTLANADIDDIDYRSRHNIFEATDYVQEQYALYKEKELSTRVSPRYMERQTQINHDMRSILIDWLVDIHFKFRCVPETLFLTVNILDRFLERKHVPKTRLQCVGVAAFLIAAKYEEIYPPELQELQYMVDNAYSKQQIIDMESKILVALRYKITVVTPRVFLVRFLKAAHADNIVVHLASYILERSLQEESFITYAPSTLAAAAVSIARRVANRRPWTPTLQYYSGYHYEELSYCINDMTSWVRSRHNSLEAVRRKYTSNKFYAVAKMDI